MSSKVDWYFDKDQKWQKAVKQLRKIILDCGLTEELKWGCPCYTFQNSNIVLIHDFKEYCALLFFKGSLLEDSHKILIQQTQNVQAARQIRFTNVQEILEKVATLKAYIYEAIEVEKAGLKVTLKETADYTIPVEFQRKLNNNKALKSAFQSLTPGRQRAYILYFSAPKQSKTKESRIEKCIQPILSGNGLND
jgi:uncharacterized protein YdeI (YjbR/CyaY-like superfamily)